MTEQPKEEKQEDMYFDHYEPDYETPCSNCGQVPTVTLVKDHMVVHHVELCGPCCWGEAETLDPDTWN